MMDKLENPDRPGPDYYSECKKFSWVDQLIEKHKKQVKESGGKYSDFLELTKEEESWIKLKEMNGAQSLKYGMSLGVTLIVFNIL